MNASGPGQSLGRGSGGPLSPWSWSLFVAINAQNTVSWHIGLKSCIFTLHLQQLQLIFQRLIHIIKNWVGSAYEQHVRIMICQIRCIEEQLTDYHQSPDVNFRFSVIM